MFLTRRQQKARDGGCQGDEWRQTENRRVQSGAYASGAIAQFQPKTKLREGYYLWRVIVTDEKGAVYETPREKWKTFRVIHHNPIVLVHGFDFAEFMKGREGTNPGNWNEAVRVMRDEFGYTPLYNSYNKDNDQPEGSPNPYADLFVVDNLDTSLGVEPNAERMRIYMSEKVRPRLSYEVVVDLIGHSMGGLISRAYVGEVYKLYRNVRGGRETAVLLASIGKEVGVERIVTIGTPHSGAPLADIWMKSPISSAAQALVRRLLGLPSDVPVVPVIYDLSTEGACKKINPKYPVKDGIEYLLFAGKLSFPTQVAVNTLYTALWAASYAFLGGVGLEIVEGPNDGIVPWWSAYWLYDCILTKQRLLTNNVKEILPEINMGIDPRAHFNLINETTTRQWMREYIKQVKGQGGFTKMLPVRRRGETIEIPEVSPLWQGVVHQGETLEHPVYLDARSDATFLVNWLVGQLSLELQSPTGETITPNQAQQGSGIEFYEIPTIWGNVKMFIVKNASQGRWVMKVRGESEVPPDGTPALMWAAFHSPLKLNVEIPKAIYSVGEGGRAVLKAQLMKASQPVTGATVTAEVIQPDGQSVTVNLLDDGEHQDGKAGDGVYGAVLTNLTEPGTYRFIVTAKGQTRQEGGTNFERSAMGSFEVASPAARLTGRYTDEGMDEDNDGLFERLRVDVQVQIQQAGSFTLSGALADGAGRTITQTSVSFEATEAGVMTISLFFDGQAIGNWNYSGRFQLRDVTLLHRMDRGMVFADSHDHPYDTREYQANQFPSTLIRQSIALREGLHFVSVPMDLVNAGWSFLLGQIPSEVKVAVWMGNGYVFYPQEPANEAQTGRGYWVKLLPGQVRELTAIGRKVSEEQPFVLPLRQGWNAIGNPFLASLTWNLDSLKVRKGTEEKTLEQAQQAGWIEDYAWGWEQDANNPNTGRYVLVYDASIIPGVKGQLEPWKGYWVYAHTDCELILPPPSQSKGRGTRGEGRMAKGNGWSMRLQASVDGSVGEAVLGIANGTRGLAVGLPPEPPTGNNGVQVILLKNNTPLAVDVRSDGSKRQEWEVLVRFGTRDGGRGTSERKEVVLTFDGIGYAPKDVSAWLVDTVTGKRIYLRTQPSYRFAPEVGETERRFKVIVESGNERPLRIVGLKATPMRGEGLVITFALTKPAQVRGEVMTLTGRKIAVMDEGSTRMAGTHRMIWRGVGSGGVKVPVGAYLVRLVATDEDGRQVQAVTVVRSR
jgi:pimeloyl-ACP methyl ester carboxylesterase